MDVNASLEALRSRQPLEFLGGVLWHLQIKQSASLERHPLLWRHMATDTQVNRGDVAALEAQIWRLDCLQELHSSAVPAAGPVAASSDVPVTVHRPAPRRLTQAESAATPSGAATAHACSQSDRSRPFAAPTRTGCPFSASPVPFHHAVGKGLAGSVRPSLPVLTRPGGASAERRVEPWSLEDCSQAFLSDAHRACWAQLVERHRGQSNSATAGLVRLMVRGSVPRSYVAEALADEQRERR